MFNVHSVLDFNLNNNFWTSLFFTTAFMVFWYLECRHSVITKTYYVAFHHAVTLNLQEKKNIKKKAFVKEEGRPLTMWQVGSSWEQIDRSGALTKCKLPTNCQLPKWIRLTNQGGLKSSMFKHSGTSLRHLLMLCFHGVPATPSVLFKSKKIKIKTYSLSCMNIFSICILMRGDGEEERETEWDWFLGRLPMCHIAVSTFIFIMLYLSQHFLFSRSYVSFVICSILFPTALAYYMHYIHPNTRSLWVISELVSWGPAIVSQDIFPSFPPLGHTDIFVT